MGFNDLLEFDETAYAARISRLPTEELMEREIEKLRQHNGAEFAIGGTIGAAFFTYGATLLVTPYHWRRLHIADRKLEMVNEELNRRGQELHKKQKRDYLIPIGCAVLVSGIGIGLEGVGDVVTNTILTHTPAGASAVEHTLGDPTTAITGLVDGVKEQVQEVAVSCHDVLNNGIFPGSHESATALASHTHWTSGHSTANMVGFHGGMVLAQDAEKEALVQASSSLAEKTAKRVEHHQGSRIKSR
jgi:hypothetical protein